MPILEFCEGGVFNKFTVIKNEDIELYCDGYDKAALQNICNSIAMGRLSDERTNLNTYLVINTDEPYAPEIVDILKRNGHWG